MGRFGENSQEMLHFLTHHSGKLLQFCTVVCADQIEELRGKYSVGQQGHLLTEFTKSYLAVFVHCRRELLDRIRRCPAIFKRKGDVVFVCGNAFSLWFVTDPRRRSTAVWLLSLRDKSGKEERKQQ
jgi:hypothetical protein